MVYLERILLLLLWVVPILFPSIVVAWAVMVVGAVAGIVAAVSGRWALWPMVGLAVGEGGFLLVAAVEPSMLLGWVHVVLVALAAIPLWWFPIPNWPKPQGPHGVGYRELDLSFEGGSAETGRVYAWYPTAASMSAGRTLQTRVEALALREVQTYLGKHPRIQAHMRFARTHAQTEADPATGQFPLVVFNHGGALWPNQNFSLMEELASAGYVAISVGHPEESAGMIYDDGTTQPLSAERVTELRGSPEGMMAFGEYLTSATPTDQAERLRTLAPTQAGTRAACERWSSQTLAVIDWFKAHGPTELSSQVDFERVVYAGMSMGGAVAYRCCQLDERAIGGVNLDGMIWDFKHCAVPLHPNFLMCYSDLTALRTNVIKHMGWKRNGAIGRPFNALYFDRADAQVFSVEYPDSQHMNFTDFSWAVRGWAKTQFTLGPTNPRRMIQSVNQLVLAFVNDCSGQTEGAVARYLEHHKHWREVA